MSKTTINSSGVAIAAGDLPAENQDFTMQNIGADNPVYIRFGGGSAVAQQNFRLAPGETITAKQDLTNQQFMKASAGIHCITDAAVTTDVIIDLGV